MEEKIHGKNTVIEKNKQYLAIDFSNRMKFSLPHYDSKIYLIIFDSFFGNAISFHYAELGGKYKGPMVYMSKALADQIMKVQEGIDKPKRPEFEKGWFCKHEHVIPKNRYVTYFRDNYSDIHYKGKKEKERIFTIDYFKEFCKRVCITCLVTPEEDEEKLGGDLKSKLPEGINIDFDHPEKITKKQIWSRYIKAGIEVVKPHWNGNKLLSYDIIKF